MTADLPNVELIGFENDSSLDELFSKFRMFEDCKAILPGHLLRILQQQYPDTELESIELLDVQKCNLGGMKQEDSETLIRVQTLEVPLELRVTLHVKQTRIALDIILVIKGEELDSAPKVKTDMHVKGQRVVE